MSAWRILRDSAVRLRLAEPADRAGLSALLASTWRRHGNQSPEDQSALLMQGLSPVALVGSEIVGFLGIDLRATTGDSAERWADVQLVAVEVGSRGEGLLGRLLEIALPALHTAGCTGVVCLAPPGWLVDGLLAAGMQAEDQVLTYAREGRRLGLPVLPDGPAYLSAAGAGHAPVILEINARAFQPLWRYDDSVIMGWMMTSDRAVIAEVDGAPAGFALTTLGLPGNYAHLVRVAADPAYQGQGVGRQLVADAVRHAHEAGAPGVALNTQASNTTSRGLYESLGFRLTGHSLGVLVARL